MKQKTAFLKKLEEKIYFNPQSKQIFVGEGDIELLLLSIIKKEATRELKRNVSVNILFAFLTTRTLISNHQQGFAKRVFLVFCSCALEIKGQKP